jgi:hypothetical protein
MLEAIGKLTDAFFKGMYLLTRFVIGMLVVLLGVAGAVVVAVGIIMGRLVVNTIVYAIVSIIAWAGLHVIVPFTIPALIVSHAILAGFIIAAVLTAVSFVTEEKQP